LTSISPRYSNYVLSLLFVVYLFNFIDRQILGILLEPIKEELQVSDTAMGFLTGVAFALFYTFAGIPIARWADVGTRRTIISLGLLVWSAMTALSGLARGFPHLALARMGVGVGEAAATPPAHSLISDYFPPERRATALGIYTMGGYLGILFGLLLGGWINEFFGWRMAFLAVGLPGVLLAVIVRLTLREPPRGHSEGLMNPGGRESTREVLRFLWGLRSFRHLSMAAALYALAAYGFYAWAPTFLIRVHDMGTGEAATWLGLSIGLGGAAGAYLGGRISDGLGASDVRWFMRIPALGAIAAIPFYVLFLFWPDKIIALIFFIPTAVLSAFHSGPTFSMTQGLAKLHMRAMASAILLFIINLIGLGLGPQTVGILNDLLAGMYGKEAIRYSLLIISVTNVWAIGHSLLAARTLREDLQAKEH
jgi:predicted MFS family arabinose efflux permease